MHDADKNKDTPKSEDCAAGGLPNGQPQVASEAHGMGRIEGEDYYVNEAGLVVFTAKYLLERGCCCGSGCKHCPYNYEAVPEPKRSLLLQKRINLNGDK